MSAIVATVVAGLGLFFVGLHQVTLQLQQSTSRRFRNLVARFTDRTVVAIVLGVLAGALMQSTSAVTVVLASMVSGRLLTVRKALPLLTWTNVGTTLIVFLTVLDVRVGVLYLVGLSGVAFAFSRDARWRTASGVLLGVGLLFFGIDLMKTAAGELQQFAWFRTALAQARGSYLLALCAGVILSFLTQSATAVALLAVTLVDAGLLQTEETMMILYGGNVGSTFARMILAGGLKGTSRQIGRFQDFFRIAGTAFFTILFYVERYGHVPLVRALVAAITDSPETQTALVNLFYNLTMALVLTPFLGPLHRLLDRLWPATASEDLAKLQYLYPQAVDDPETCLDLVESEQRRQVGRLPEYLLALRPPIAGRPKVDFRALHQAFLALGREVAYYCSVLLHRPLPARTSDRLTNIHGRQEEISHLEESVYQLTAALAEAPPPGRLGPLLRNFLEALEFILGVAGDALAGGAAGDVELLAHVSGDRSELLGRIRNLYLSEEQGLSASEKSLLLALTARFDRIVWTLRRLALLLKPELGERA